MTALARPSWIWPRPCRKHRRGLKAFLGWLFTIAWAGDEILWDGEHISWECPDCERDETFVKVDATFSYEFRQFSSAQIICVTEGCFCRRSCVRVNIETEGSGCTTIGNPITMTGTERDRSYRNDGELRPIGPFPCPDESIDFCGGTLVSDTSAPSSFTVTIQSQTVGTQLQYRAYVASYAYSAWQDVDPGWSSMNFTIENHAGSSFTISGNVTLSNRPGCNCPTNCGRCGFASGEHQGDYLVSLSGTPNAGEDDGSGYLDLSFCTWTGAKGTLYCDGQAWHFVSNHGHEWIAEQGDSVTCCPPDGGWTPVAPNTGSLTVAGS